MTIRQIRYANARAGGFFFSPDTMRFFRSRVGRKVYQGRGGIFFVTSEKGPHQDTRGYTVRRFDPATGDVETFGPFNSMDSYQANRLACMASKAAPDSRRAIAAAIS